MYGCRGVQDASRGDETRRRRMASHMGSSTPTIAPRTSLPFDISRTIMRRSMERSARPSTTSSSSSRLGTDGPAFLLDEPASGLDGPASETQGSPEPSPRSVFSPEPSSESVVSSFFSSAAAAVASGEEGVLSCFCARMGQCSKYLGQC